MYSIKIWSRYTHVSWSHDGNGQQEFCDEMEVEIAGLEQKNTWNIGPQTQTMAQNKKILPGAWSFKQKQYPDWYFRKYNAGFCLHRDKQVISVDIFETYAPVVQLSSVCLCFILIVILDLSLRQVDYTNNFVWAKVKTQVQMFVFTQKSKPQCLLSYQMGLNQT